jgi:hypothetical protein
MNTAGVDAILRDLIIHLGLPFTVLSVIESPAGWNIQVRAGTKGLMRFSVPNGRPVAIRVAIQQKLEE